MYEGFEYASKYGILEISDYREYTHNNQMCSITEEDLRRKRHLYDIGYMEHDGRTNSEFIQLLQIQPISISIRSGVRFMGYSRGILTEKYLECSDPDLEVNHGVLLVGYGEVDDEHVLEG